MNLTKNRSTIYKNIVIRKCAILLSTNHVILKNLIESQCTDLNKTDKFIYREKV